MTVLVAFAAAALSLPQAGRGDYVRTDVKEPGYEGMYYTLFVPKPLKRGKRYPLVFALHGNGQKSDGHVRNIARVSSEELPVFVVAPQYQHYEKGYKFNNPRWKNVGVVFRKILDAICDKHPIDKSRLILQGFSMGSNYACAWTYRWFEKEPKSFPFRSLWMNGTAVPPRGKAPRIPYLLFVGSRETAVLGRINVVKQVRSCYRRMFKRRYDVRYLEIPGMGHSVNAKCHEIMHSFLAALPSHRGCLSARMKIDPACASAAADARAGRFAEALAELDRIRAPSSSAQTSTKTNALSIRRKLEAYLRKLARTSTGIDGWHELQRLHPTLQAEPALQKALASGIKKLERAKKLKNELAAFRQFQEAREKTLQGLDEGFELFDALHADPALCLTENGRRASQHIRALTDTYEKAK